MASIISVDKLTKRYGASRGVDNVSFEVVEGEVFGFLGPNGAGKTTTIRTLLGLLRPTSGGATIAGLDCWAQSTAVKRLVGYLPGEFTLDPALTGAHILAYLGYLRGGVDLGYVTKLVERLELDPSKRFRDYSRGNKQKVGLVQAFMHRARPSSPRTIWRRSSIPATALASSARDSSPTWMRCTPARISSTTRWS